MSKTGTYKVVGGKVVRISDRVPCLRPRVYVKRGGQYFHNLGHQPVWVEDVAHKRRILDRLDLAEAG